MKQLLLLAFVLAASAVAKDKAPGPIPQMYPTERTIAAPCDSVWSAVLQSFMKAGFSVKLSDKSGGIIALEWTRGDKVGAFRFINPLVREFTLAKSTGFWTQYTGFRIAGASALLNSEGDSCHCAILMTYHGFERRVQSGEGWLVLESNGFRESQLLDEIDGKTKRLQLPEIPAL